MKINNFRLALGLINIFNSISLFVAAIIKNAAIIMIMAFTVFWLASFLIAYSFENENTKRRKK
jgi:hypothetical protein